MLASRSVEPTTLKNGLLRARPRPGPAHHISAAPSSSAALGQLLEVTRRPSALRSDSSTSVWSDGSTSVQSDRPAWLWDDPDSTQPPSNKPLYPGVVGLAADVGQKSSLRALTKPIWANDAWRHLLSSLGHDAGDESLFDVVATRDAAALVDFLALACRLTDHEDVRMATGVVPPSVTIRLRPATLSSSSSSSIHTDLHLTATVLPTSVYRTDRHLLLNTIWTQQQRMTTLPDVSVVSFAPVTASSHDDPFHHMLRRTVMGRLIAEHPWHLTSLGPISTWSEELRSIVNHMLFSPFREAIWVGEEMVILYNDAYALLSMDKHPWLLGKPGAVAWAELWDALGPLVSDMIAGNTVVR